MSLRFTSEKSIFPVGIILTAILFLIILSIFLLVKFAGNNTEAIIVTIISLVIVLLFLWILFGTYYKLERKNLLVHSGPFNWKIRVRDIKTIRLNQKTYGGIFKAALSWDGIEIKYKKNNSIYISPINQKKFIKKIQKINKDIEIKKR